MIKKILPFAFAAAFLGGCAATSPDEAQVLSQKCAPQDLNSSSCAPSKTSAIGIYKATLPCASCSGIDMTLELLPNGKFRSIATYVGKQNYTETQSGTYTVFADRITTTDEYKEKTSYKFDGQNLEMISPDGTQASKELREYYIFKRVK